jgi:hypothetical protein
MGDLILFVARHITFRWIDAYGLGIERQFSYLTRQRSEVSARGATRVGHVP